MEFSIHFALHTGRALPSAPQALYRGETLPLPERARVLKLVMAIMQHHLLTGRIFLGGVLTKCTALIPLPGPMVVGLSACPYFTSRHQMLPMILSLRKYCETSSGVIRVLLNLARFEVQGGN